MATQAFKKLRDVVLESSTQSRIDPAIANKMIFDQLNEVAAAFTEAIDPSLYKDDCLSLLEEICVGKKIALTKSFQISLRSVYHAMIRVCPGYIIRNIINSMVNVCNNKLTTIPGRELAIWVMSDIFQTRLNDCASQVSDALALVSKLVKSSDFSTRAVCISLLETLVGSNIRNMHDIYGDVYKIVGRMMTDKSPEVRLKLAHLMGCMARCSGGFTAISAENLQSGLGKGIEDEDVNVQAASCSSLASIYEILVRTYIDKQELSKIGAARGTDDNSKQAKTTPSRLTTLTKLTSTRKAIVEETNDFKSVLDTLCKQVMKTVGNVKVGHILVLGYFIQGCIDQLTLDDFELIPAAFLSLTQDPVALPNSTSAPIVSTFEDQVLLRTRLSFIFRTFFLGDLTESQILTVGGQLARLCSADAKTDIEVQFALVELNHIISALGSAAVCIQEDCTACAMMMLRHASFGVRTAAANLLLSLTLIVPGLAADLMSTALSNTQTQYQQLLQTDGFASDVDSNLFEDHSEHASAATGGGAVPPPPATTPTSARRPSLSAKMKKDVREVERMQRMFFFHGHALLLALLLKHAARLPQGLPSELINQVFSLGLDLMRVDNSSNVPSLKPIICSINRAGALIASSYLSLGYILCRPNISSILQVCDRLLGTSAIASSGGSSKDWGNAGQSSPMMSRGDEVLYEIMTVEAGLVVVTSLLSYCNDAVIYVDGCLAFCINALETCFKNAKNKYAVNYKNHFRFRTFHTLLLECFSLLPGGSYPNSCQQVYIEALKVLRDALSNGLECSSEMLNDHSLVTPSSAVVFRPMLYRDAVTSELHYMLRLEQMCTSLQKKECEAFLAVFGKEVEALSFFDQTSHIYLDGLSTEPSSLARSQLQDADSRRSRFQSSVMDSRGLDACVDLIATTFPHQAADYQDKAIQLCIQAVGQLNAGTLGVGNAPIPPKKGITLFGNDEERKKKEKRLYIGMKTLVCLLYNISKAFPVHHGQFYDVEFTWRQSLVDLLYDALSVHGYNIQHKAARGLALFASKWQGSNIIQTGEWSPHPIYCRSCSLIICCAW